MFLPLTLTLSRKGRGGLGGLLPQGEREKREGEGELLDGNRLGEIARFVDVGAASQRGVVGENL